MLLNSTISLHITIKISQIQSPLYFGFSFFFHSSFVSCMVLFLSILHALPFLFLKGMMFLSPKDNLFSLSIHTLNEKFSVEVRVSLVEVECSNHFQKLFHLKKITSFWPLFKSFFLFSLIPNQNSPVLFYNAVCS